MSPTVYEIWQDASFFEHTNSWERARLLGRCAGTNFADACINAHREGVISGENFSADRETNKAVIGIRRLSPTETEGNRHTSA